MAEELFRHRVLRLLNKEQLLGDERIELLLSWRRSGFNIDDSVRIPAGENTTLEKVARYMLRSPVSLSRMQWSPGSPHVLYAPKNSHDDPRELFPRLEKIDALEFLARVITQIPEPRRHLLFYYGHYSNVLRGRRKISQPSEQQAVSSQERQEDEPTLSPARKQALRRRWADLIRRGTRPTSLSLRWQTPRGRLHHPASCHPKDPRTSERQSQRRPSPSSSPNVPSDLTRRHPSTPQ